MVKRRLSDLVQEEVTKSPSTIDVTATPVISTDDSEESSAALPVESKSTEVVEEKITPKPTVTQPDSEAEIKKLNESIAQARQNEANLQKEVNKLQSSLDEHRSKAESLSKELKDAKKVAQDAKKEVQDAKNAAVQLAESNSQLSDEISSLKDRLVQLEQEKQQEQERLEQKQALAKPPKETYKPAPDYRKSHHALSHRPIDRTPAKPIEESKTNSSPMWLLD
jgi:chromosome segregation ATPase